MHDKAFSVLVNYVIKVRYELSISPVPVTWWSSLPLSTHEAGKGSTKSHSTDSMAKT